MPAALERCVQHVKAKGGAKNAWAVCRASMGSDAEIRRRHGGGGGMSRNEKRAAKKKKKGKGGY